MSVPEDLRDRVDSWIADDPDEETRAELSELLKAAGTDETACAELADRFAGSLEFGTAGLRGELAAGPNRMNRAVVIRAAAGLGAYLKDSSLVGSVVIGFDARHKSDVFARDTAAVMRGVGIDAVLLPGPLPTPLLAFAIRHLGCAAGVMVTASHNPPRDNGYKVYLGDGSQIVPPADAEISTRIDDVTSAMDVPRGDGWTVLGEGIVDAYVEAVAALPSAWHPQGAHDGGTRRCTESARASSKRCSHKSGFATPVVVPEQAEPDPDFPTVPVPQPGGARCSRPRRGPRRAAWRRHRDRERPRRRPVCRRRLGPARLADAARR